MDANQTNCPTEERHRGVQADVLPLPCPTASGDLVISHGTIQHTPEREAAIAELSAKVTPAGSHVIDRYRPSLAYFGNETALLVRPIVKRRPPDHGSLVMELFTKLFHPVHRAVRHHRLLQMLLSRISPLYTYLQTCPQPAEPLRYEWGLVDTHDGLTDSYKHLRTGLHGRAARAALEAVDIRVAKGGNRIEERCRKPSRT